MGTYIIDALNGKVLTEAEILSKSNNLVVLKPIGDTGIDLNRYVLAIKVDEAVTECRGYSKDVDGNYEFKVDFGINVHNRRHVRVDINKFYYIRNAKTERQFSSTLMNLSFSGMRFKTRHDVFEKDDRVVIEIKYGPNSTFKTGRIVFKMTKDKGTEYGVEFEKFTMDDIVLYNYLNYYLKKMH